jgi:hypothetical protein
LSFNTKRDSTPPGSPFSGVATGGLLKWEDVKDRIDMVKVVTGLLGEPPGRRGERSSKRVWWSCPFHDDVNPSFAAFTDKANWKCFGCGESGDAPELVMRLKGCGFRDAVTYLAVGIASPVAAPRSKGPTARKAPAVDPDAMTNDEAAAMVADAEGRLWGDEGRHALEYLRGRGLKDSTIRAARLGWTPRAVKTAWTPRGIVVPWIRSNMVVLVKVRCDDDFRARFDPKRCPPRYLEAYRHPWTSDLSDPPVFPGLDVVEPGLPLVVVEGEVDCLLLGQILEGAASVITLGGASSSPGPSTIAAITPAWPRYAAQDDDAAGDKAAQKWPASFRRVKPPGSFHKTPDGRYADDKDWSDAQAQGINLPRWWAQILDGVERPPMFTLDELVARNPPEPAEPWAGIDPYDAMEREAIQSVEREEVTA